VPEHRHDVKPPGECPECDLSYIPENLRAVRPDGEQVPVTATYNGLNAAGLHEWVVVAPESPVSYFEADSGLPEGHALSFVSPEWAHIQERAQALEEDGPESGPREEEQDEHDR
jgi:hypothetical protein